MSRIRSIKPEFFLNDELAALGPLTALLFVGLWTEADREGRLRDRPARIKASILPYYDCDADALLDSLTPHFIERYEADGERFIQVVNFSNHQCPNVKEPASTIPAPCQHSASTVPAHHYKEGKGKEGKERDARAEDSPPKQYAATLPSCLATLRDRERNQNADATIRQDFEAAFGMTSPAEWGEFCHVVRDGCIDGCSGDKRQAAWCAEHVELKLRDKSAKSWRHSSLLRTALLNDRKPVPPKEVRR